MQPLLCVAKIRNHQKNPPLCSLPTHTRQATMVQVISLVVTTKALAGPLCLLFILVHGNFGAAAALQLAIRSAYGVCWILQDHAFPTATWNYQASAATTIAVTGWLGVFVPFIDWLCIANTTQASPNEMLDFLALFGTAFLFSIGLLFMMVTDSCTRLELRLRSEAKAAGTPTSAIPSWGRTPLITSGLNSLMRHPNYFGETLIYASFCLNARSWWAWVIMAGGWACIVMPSMLKKDKRLSRHPGWGQFCARCGLMWPKTLAVWSDKDAAKGIQKFN